MLCIIIYKRIFNSKHLAIFSKKTLKPVKNSNQRIESYNRNFIAKQYQLNEPFGKNELALSSSSSASSSSNESIKEYGAEYKRPSLNEIINEDEHKYHEIADYSTSENIVSVINNDESPKTLLVHNDNNYFLSSLNQDSENIEIKNEHLPPPYNKIHMFKNATQSRTSLHKKTCIHGKSTYV